MSTYTVGADVLIIIDGEPLITSPIRGRQYDFVIVDEYHRPPGIGRTALALEDFAVKEQPELDYHAPELLKCPTPVKGTRPKDWLQRQGRRRR